MKTDSYPRSPRRAAELAVFVTAIVLLSCVDPAGPGTTVPSAGVLAKGGGSTSEVTVTATKPDTGSQGTTLDVTISGSGFTSDMAATWELDGISDPSQVRTNSTRYVSSKQLVANITIGAGAAVAKWDVRVTSTRCCKGGIGIELFEVKLVGNVDSDPRALLEWDDEVNVAEPGSAAEWRPAGITGDGRDRVGAASSGSSYQGDFCGVRAKIHMGNGGGDLVFDPDIEFNNAVGRKCGGKRGLLFYLNYVSGGARGSGTLLGTFTNVLGAGILAEGGNGRIPFEVGEPQGRRLRFWYVGQKDCSRIVFEENPYAQTYPGVRDALVTRLADAGTTADGAPIRRWRVESQYPHIAVCVIDRGGAIVPTGTRYLPFAFTATEVPFPYPTYP